MALFPRISIIVPVFNREELIGRTLASVLAQTFRDYEVIIIDDGSTDRTRDVVAGFAQQDARIRYLYQSNSGPGAARNRGITASRGQWIAFLDSDDVWEVSKLENACRLMEADHELEFIHTNWHALYPNGTKGRPRDSEPFDDLRSKRYLLRRFCLKTSTVLIKRDLIERLGGYFYTHRPICEDYHLFWRAIIATKAVGYIESCDTIAFQTEVSLLRSSSRPYEIECRILAMTGVSEWVRAQDMGEDYAKIFDEWRYWEFRELFALLIRMRAFGQMTKQFLHCCRTLSPVRGIRGLLSAILAA